MCRVLAVRAHADLQGTCLQGLGRLTRDCAVGRVERSRQQHAPRTEVAQVVGAARQIGSGDEDSCAAARWPSDGRRRRDDRIQIEVKPLRVRRVLLRVERHRHLSRAARDRRDVCRRARAHEDAADDGRYDAHRSLAGRREATASVRAGAQAARGAKYLRAVRAVCARGADPGFVTRAIVGVQRARVVEHTRHGRHRHIGATEFRSRLGAECEERRGCVQLKGRSDGGVLLRIGRDAQQDPPRGRRGRGDASDSLGDLVKRSEHDEAQRVVAKAARVVVPPAQMRATNGDERASRYGPRGRACR